MAIKTFFPFLQDQQVMSGGIAGRPSSTGTADTYLVGGTAVTAETIIVASDMAAERQFRTRHDLAVVVRIKLDVVQ